MADEFEVEEAGEGESIELTLNGPQVLLTFNLPNNATAYRFAEKIRGQLMEGRLTLMLTLDPNSMEDVTERPN